MTQTIHGATRRPGLPIGTPEERRIAATLSRIGRVLFVVSGKGGVGKSSVTANLAATFAGRSLRVGVLDADMHGPSIPTLLGVGRTELPSEDGAVLEPVTDARGIKVISMDTLLENRNKAVIWRGPRKTAAIRQFISGVNWGDLDILLIDSPPGTGDEHLAVLGAVPAAECVMVTTPQEVALADVRKAVHFLRKLDAHVLGLVENMSGLICPHCAGAIDLFSKGGGRRTAEEEGLSFLGAIPIDPLMAVAADRGEPVVDLLAESPARDAFARIAAAVLSGKGELAA